MRNGLRINLLHLLKKWPGGKSEAKPLRLIVLVLLLESSMTIPISSLRLIFLLSYSLQPLRPLPACWIVLLRNTGCIREPV